MSNTITAYFKGRIGVAEAVYQNDYGIVMAFDSIDLPAHFDCYFSRLNQEEALPGVGADSRVAIPNSILADPGNVTIHIPIHTGANDSEVEYVVYFKVIGRARPIDDAPPTQMTAIEKALALLSQPITNIEEIVNEALAFTGETFDEMKAELNTWKGGVEYDFDNLDAQFQTAVSALTVDSEVQNIRVGDDNVTYTSAGDAVRTQFSNVKSNLNSVANLSIFTMSNATYGYSINESGTVTSGATSAYTDYIPVDPETKYMFSGIMDSTAPVSSMNFRIHEYDSSKEWIKQGTYINVPKGLDPALYKSSTFTTSATTKYVRISLGIASAITDAKFINETEGGATAIDTVARSKFEIIDNNTNDIEGLKKQSYIYEDVTSAFTVNTGQAYGTVGSHITTSTSQEYKNVRISKSANVAKVKFSTSYNPNISSYIQYVDDNDIIISRDFEKGSYNISSLYEYEPNFPTGATGMYVSAGWKTPSGFDNLLEIYEISDLTFSDLYEIANNKVERDYNEIVKSVNRIADGLTVPQQSIIGYKTAYKLGFRAMLCDLRFTSDGVPVLFHDDYLNQYSNIVYDSNGQLVPTTNPIYIDQTSYEDLLDYDFGLYKGATYANTPILSLEDMLDLCKLLGCEVWLEMKVNPTTAQFDTVFSLISKYGMREKCYFAPQTLTQLSDLISYNPDVYINFHSNIASGETMTDEKVNAIVNATTDYNRYKNNITLSKTANITAAQVEALSEAGVGLMMGTMNTKNDVTTFYNRGVPYTCVTYALCTADVIAGKVLFETIQLN